MANLEALPVEVFTAIATQVKGGSQSSSLSALAATCRQYQIYVENITFCFLSVNQARVPAFKRFVCPRRFKALRRLCLTIFRQRKAIADKKPQTFSQSEGYEVIRVIEENYAECDNTFTQEIVDFLSALKAKCDAGTDLPKIQLFLDSDGVLPDTWLNQELGTELIGNRENWDVISYEKSLRRRWAKLGESVQVNDLQVPVVSALYQQDGKLWENIWPASWSTLLSRFPNLRELEIKIDDNERKALVSRQEARDSFGQSLQFWPASLEKVCLEYLGYAPSNHFETPPCLTHPERGHDIVSHELGRLSQSLITLKLRSATLDIEEFFSSGTSGGWPRLRQLEFIDQQIASADGTWYFDLDTRISADEYQENHGTADRPLAELWAEDPYKIMPATMDYPIAPFRTAMDLQRFSRIYIVIAEAVKNMPSLQSFDISFELTPFSYEFEVQHEMRFVAGSDRWCKNSCAEIKVGWGLVPAMDIPSDVIEAWRAVGVAKGASIELFIRTDPWDWDNFQILE